MYFSLISTGAFHCDGLRASDVLPILKEKIAYCSGTWIGEALLDVVWGKMRCYRAEDRQKQSPFGWLGGKRKPIKREDNGHQYG